MNREKVIEELQKAKEILGKVEEPTFWLDFVQVALRNAIELLDVQPTVELVRCKDCKHRGILLGRTAFDIKWPDSRCPCQCDDSYYSWIPKDDWYCANGERKSVNSEGR